MPDQLSINFQGEDIVLQIGNFDSKWHVMVDVLPKNAEKNVDPDNLDSFSKLVKSALSKELENELIFLSGWLQYPNHGSYECVFKDA